jgi:hypothetical protein
LDIQKLEANVASATTCGTLFDNAAFSANQSRLLKAMKFDAIMTVHEPWEILF